jgi:drug/metabolite transporter (DMT)-like permease
MDRQKLFTWTPAVTFFALVCALLWGSAFPLVKIGFRLLEIERNTGGKLYFAAYRFLLAGLMTFAVVRLTGRSIRLPEPRDYATFFLLGLLQTTFMYTIFYIGLSNTTGMKASIINGSGSFFIALSSHLWVKDDTLTPKKNIGLVLGFLGVSIVNFNKGGFGFDFHLTGEGFVLLAALASTAGTLLVKKSSRRIHPPLMSAYQLTLGSLILLLIALAVEDPAVIRFSGSTLLLLGYLSFLSAFAFSLWYVLVKYNQLTSMAMYRFLIPVCGTFLSAAILEGETLDWLAIVSLALVSIGMLLTSRKQAPIVLGRP